MLKAGPAMNSPPREYMLASYSEKWETYRKNRYTYI